MRLQLRVLGLALVLSVVTACGTDPEFGLYVQHPGKFAELPGRLCILIANNQSRWKFELANGALRAKVSCDELGDALAGHLPQHAQIQALLPKQAGYEYRGAWALSADKRTVAAAVAGSGDVRFIEDQFVIVDALAKNVVARVRRKPGEFLVAMAWSPTSSHLAVIYGKEEGRCGRSLLSAISGHPVRCMRFGIEVFDPKGAAVANATFAQHIPGGGASVAWLKD